MDNEPHAPYNITIAYYETHNTQLTHYYDKRNQVLYLRKDLSEEEQKKVFRELVNTFLHSEVK